MQRPEHVRDGEVARRPAVARAPGRPRPLDLQGGPRTGAGGPALQRALGNQAVGALLADDLSAVTQVVGSPGGAPLEPRVRADMEARLGGDFGDVRVHTDDRADESARAVGADAYTVGPDVVFRRGRFDPSSAGGREVLAHELVHVVQQRQGPVGGVATPAGLRVVEPSDPLEQAAVVTARRAVADSAAGDTAASGRRVTTPRRPVPEGAAPAGRGSTPPGGPVLQRIPSSTVTFDEPEVVTGHVTSLGPALPSAADPHALADKRCEAVARRMRETVSRTGHNATIAVEQFAEYMHFPAEEETVPDLLGTATDFALEEGFKLLWTHAMEPIKAVPGVDKLLDLTLALAAETRRAEEAKRRVGTRDWIVGERGRIATKFDRLLKAMDDLESDLWRGYAAVVAADERPTTTGVAGTAGQEDRAGIAQGDVTLVGPGAEYLNRIQAAAADAKDREPSWQTFMQWMIEKWVRQRETSVESRGGGGLYHGGRIYLTVEIDKVGDDYRVTLPTTGTLAAPEPARTADAVSKLMEDTGRTVNDLAILKHVEVEITEEVRGFNEHYRTWMEYRDPEQIVRRGPNLGSRVTREDLERADAVVPVALGRFELTDIRVQDLTSAAE